jgi:O-antigen/teichoic acid export membrane protein
MSGPAGAPPTEAPRPDDELLDDELPNDELQNDQLQNDHDALSSRVARGLKWSLLSSVLGRVVTPLTSIILVHVLVPADFGVFSVALVVQSALLSFNDLGVTNALVWWRGDVRHAARTATSLAMLTSGGLYAMCFLAAPVIAGILGSPSASGVLRLLCLSVVIDGISSVPIGLLNRAFRQDKRAFADWFGFILSTGLTIGLAYAGFGAWSLAWGRLAGNAVTTTSLFIFARERPRPGWDREVAGTLVRYGLPLCGASILVFAFLNVDYIVVGHVLGVAALGIYTIAFNLASWPSNVLSTTIRRVSIPAFSRLQDEPEALSTTFLAGLRNLMMVTLPLCAGLSALAIPVVSIVYPPAYAEAGPVLALLAVLGATRVFLDFMYDLLSGTGRTSALFALQALWIALLIPALVIGANASGIAGVAKAHVIVATGIMVPIFTLIVARRGASARLILAQVGRPVAASVLGWLAATVIVHNTTSNLLGILLGGSALVIIYVLLAARFAELWTLPKRLLRFEPVPV